MDHAMTWKLMCKEKKFIRTLYDSSSPKTILLNASDGQLKVIIQILHLIASNTIHISDKADKAIEKGKKGKYIHTTFLQKKKVLQLFKLDKADKVAFIYDVRCFLGISDLPTYLP